MLPAHALGNKTNPRGVQFTEIGALGTRKDAKLSVRWHYLSTPKGMPSTFTSTRSSIINVIPTMKRTLRRSRSNSSSSFLSVPLKTNANRNANAAASAEAVPPPPTAPPEHDEGRRDPRRLWRRFWTVAAPYWSSDDRTQARLQLAAVFALTLGTTGISVGFNFLGRDFYNALANKDAEQFTKQLFYYLAGFAGGIPFFVLRDYAREILSLRWRSWMTSYYMERYLKDRTFYKIQSQSIIDNPDQRIVDDLSSFTATALSFSLTFFNAAVDLISFSNILYGIYPPLFIVLLLYSIGGTVISVLLGRGLVTLNFMQEKKEADFRYGLVRVRENAESIAFYGGEENELHLLLQRFNSAFQNLSKLLIASRNLEFFTNGYRYLIQILPAAVVAPMYFSGKIEFGVINQSVSAFNHILGDFSLIVFQFQAISAFSAVIDRLGTSWVKLLRIVLWLDNDIFAKHCSNKAGYSSACPPLNSYKPWITLGSKDTLSWKLLGWCLYMLWGFPGRFSGEFDDVLNRNLKESLVVSPSNINIVFCSADDSAGPDYNGRASAARSPKLVEIEILTMVTPTSKETLIRALSLTIHQNENLLVMGASGSGKTSLLRAMAGLWNTGSGKITYYVEDVPVTQPSVSFDGTLNENSVTFEEFQNASLSSRRIFFLPQRPYMNLGTLRQQLLYPTWVDEANSESDDSSSSAELPFLVRRTKFRSARGRAPTTDELITVLEDVRLGYLLPRFKSLDSTFEWSSVLSLGEQQRLSFARLLLSKPKLALLDESTSALDEANEAHLYQLIRGAGISYISVGHRTTLYRQHRKVLRILSVDSDRNHPNWKLENLAQDSLPATGVVEP